MTGPVASHHGDPIAEVAERVAQAEKTALAAPTMRIGIITALESGAGSRAQLDIFGSAWLQLDTDSGAGVGDRVYAFMQGRTGVICGRLTGSPSGGSSVAPESLVPIGALMPYAAKTGGAAPTNWMLCQGQLLDRTDFADLFAVCGTTYGTTTSSNFMLPNLTGRVPFPEGGAFARGAFGGAQTVTLATGDLPSHTHSSAGGHTHDAIASHDHGAAGTHGHNIPAKNGTAATGSAVGVKNSTGTGNPYTADNDGSHTHTSAGGHTHASDGGHTHTAVGSGNAHENMPPYLVTAYIIRVK